MNSLNKPRSFRDLLQEPSPWLGLAWGFCEATFFFIVPDVLLTWSALFSVKQSFRTLAMTTLGALLGGSVLYFWALWDLSSATAMVRHVPFVDPWMFSDVHDKLQTMGMLALLKGPLTGVPYKIFAIQSPAYASFPLFLLASLAARLERFAAGWLLIVCCGMIQRKLMPKLFWLGMPFHVICWTTVYLIYWKLI